MMPYIELESMKSVYFCPYVVEIGPIFVDSSPILRNCKIYLLYEILFPYFHQAVIAQLGERQTEDLKVPGSIPGRGIVLQHIRLLLSLMSLFSDRKFSKNCKFLKVV